MIIPTLDMMVYIFARHTKTWRSVWQECTFMQFRRGRGKTKKNIVDDIVDDIVHDIACVKFH